MANILGYTNKVLAKFTSVRREFRVVNLVADGLPPVEAEEGVDV